MKDQVLRFNEKTRIDLIKDILDREKKIEDQERQIAENKKRIAELEAKLGKTNALDEHRQFLKAERLAKIKTRPRRPGQKAGHVGVTREKPTKMDRIVEQTLKKCPDCNERLSVSQEVVEHVRIPVGTATDSDLKLPPIPILTGHCVVSYRCFGAKRRFGFRKLFSSFASRRQC